LAVLQLCRIHVRTPPGPYRLAVRPRVRWCVPGGAADRPAAAVGADAAPATSAGTAAAACCIEFGLQQQQGQLQLPADSVVVLTLPQVYAAPAAWLHSLCPAAAEHAAGAAVMVLPVPWDARAGQCASPTAAAAAAGGVDAPEEQQASTCCSMQVPLVPLMPCAHSTGVRGWHASLVAGWLVPCDCTDAGC
jgi:hypothetical protein